MKKAKIKRKIQNQLKNQKQIKKNQRFCNILKIIKINKGTTKKNVSNVRKNP